MSTATPPSEPTVTTTDTRDPVFDELGFPTDPDNLYTQTVGQMLTTLNDLLREDEKHHAYARS